MADSLSQCLQKSRNSRGSDNKKFKDYRTNSHSKKGDSDDDRRYRNTSRGRSRSSYRDSKNELSDRNERIAINRTIQYPRSEDRRVSFRSEDNYPKSPIVSPRHNDLEKKRDNYRNSTPRDEGHQTRFADPVEKRSVYNNHRNVNHEMINERCVSFRDNFPLESHTKRDELVESLYAKIDYLSNQVDYFAQENEMLRRNPGDTRNAPGALSNAEVNITFRNKNLEEKYLPALQDLVSRLISGHIKLEDLINFLISPKNVSQQPQPCDEAPEGELFSLDNSIVETDENNYVPRYESSFCEILQSDGSSKKEESGDNRNEDQFKKGCFNCNGDHLISQCPQQINQWKVANSRKKRLKTTYVPSVRYHVYGAKETDFKPGVISDELRKAMDLGPEQIPLYIYRMRVLSYPPGWLEEARVESSGITLYGLEGAEKNENNPEGPPVQYDPDKFVDFPGFNVPLPPDVVDECFELGFPALQRHHLRSVVEENMPKPDIKPKLKRKLDPLCAQPSKVQRVEEDMEIEDTSNVGSVHFQPPLPEEPLPPPPLPEDSFPLPPLPEESFPSPTSPEIITIEDDDEKDSDSQSGIDTPMSDSVMETLAPVVQRFKLQNKDFDGKGTSLPSLKDLEEIKKQLVMELGLASGSSSPAVQDGNHSDGQVEDITHETLDSLDSVYNNQDNSNDVSSFSDCSFASSPSASRKSSKDLQRRDSQRSGSKLVSLGTPSLSRHSSFKKLPEYENFSKDVSDHINFENLPNSVGTYQKMKKVIKKVKDKINSFMQ